MSCYLYSLMCQQQFVILAFCKQRLVIYAFGFVSFISSEDLEHFFLLAVIVLKCLKLEPS